MAQRQMLDQNRAHYQNPQAVNGTLSLGLCNMGKLPPMFPVWVRHLNVCWSGLHSLGNRLPAQLESLDASTNLLCTLPDSLPSSLKILNVSNNQLHELPNNLPRNLLTLDASNNHIVELHSGTIQTFKNMRRGATVDLRGNPLCQQTINQLNALRNDPQYRGAVIHFNTWQGQEAVLRPTPVSQLTTQEQNPHTRIRETWQAKWRQWASEPHDPHENRNDAVLQLNTWLETNLPALQTGDDTTELTINNCRLNSLPPLPEDVVRLNIDSNRLTGLAEELPLNLSVLSINNNQLASLPVDLRDNLTQLSAKQNQLVELPENLPGNLTWLFLDDNALTEFPKNLPPTIRILSLRNNRIVDLPDSAIAFIMVMHRYNSVDLRGNPLSQDSIDRLEALQHNPQYRGARIQYDRPQGSPLPANPLISLDLTNNTQAQSGMAAEDFLTAMTQQLTRGRTAELGQAAAAWVMPQTPTNIAATRRLWQNFALEPGAPQFAEFLNRLHHTVNTNKSAFQRGVAQLLTQLENNPNLRQDTFAVSVGATESCEDRISLTLNTMRKLSMAAEVSRGKYDQRLPELIQLARGMFRLEQLESIAGETSATLAQARGHNRIDEIGVYLGYQVMLRKPLALPVNTNNMAHFRTCGLTQSNLNQAKARVKAAERKEFANYLSTNFTPWREVIQRLAPQLHEQAQERLIDAMGDEFNNRLANQLTALGLQNNPDAEREMGVQVLKQIEQEVYGQLTRDFLASKGMLNLLG